MLKRFLVGLCMSVLVAGGSFAADKAAGKTAEKKAELDLSVAIQIDEQQISLNNSLLAIDHSAGVKVILSPELSSPQMLNKQLQMKTGAQPLREVLDAICAQIGGSWMVDDKGTGIAIEKGKNGATVTKKAEKPMESTLDVEYPGVSFVKVAADLQNKTGVSIDVPKKLQNKQVQIMVRGWTLKRILDHLCFMYDMKYTVGAKGKVVFAVK